MKKQYVDLFKMFKENKMTNVTPVRLFVTHCVEIGAVQIVFRQPSNNIPFVSKIIFRCP